MFIYIILSGRMHALLRVHVFLCLHDARSFIEYSQFNETVYPIFKAYNWYKDLAITHLYRAESQLNKAICQLWKAISQFVEAISKLNKTINQLKAISLLNEALNKLKFNKSISQLIKILNRLCVHACTRIPPLSRLVICLCMC